MPTHDRTSLVFRRLALLGVLAAAAISPACSCPGKPRELTIDYAIPPSDHAVAATAKAYWVGRDGTLYTPVTDPAPPAPSAPLAFLPLSDSPQRVQVKIRAVGNLPPAYVGVLDAFGRLQAAPAAATTAIQNDAICTVVHIGGGVMLTAAHCLPPIRQQGSCPFGQTSCAGYTMTFGWYADQPPAYTYPCDCVEEIVPDANGPDYAKIGVKNYATMHQLPILSLAGQDPGNGAQIAMFEFFTTGPLVYASGCVRKGGTSSLFDHDCYTQASASGAAILLPTVVGTQVGSSVAGIQGVHHGVCQNLGCGTPQSSVH
jgi:hypothetical protein